MLMGAIVIASVMFYVSPSGNDNNPGTFSSPWRTVQHAAQKIQAGHTAVLMDGIYEEPEIHFAAAGTQSAPITIKAMNKWKAVISSYSGHNPAVSLYHSYLAIEDLKIVVSPHNVRAQGYSSANCSIRAWPDNNAVGGAIRRVWIQAPKGLRDCGIKISQDNAIVEDSIVDNEIESFYNLNMTIRHNIVSGGGPNSTYIVAKGGNRNVQVSNNIVHTGANASAQPLIAGGTTGNQWVFDPTQGWEIYDSTFDNNVIVNESGNAQLAAVTFMSALRSHVVEHESLRRRTVY